MQTERKIMTNKSQTRNLPKLYVQRPSSSVCIVNGYNSMVRRLWRIFTEGTKSNIAANNNNNGNLLTEKSSGGAVMQMNVSRRRSCSRKTLQDLIVEGEGSILGPNVRAEKDLDSVFRRSFSVSLPREFGSGLTGDTVALVMYSSNPLQDFRDSIHEMIMENDSRDPNFLDQLACCYLALNAPEYHRLITRAFAMVFVELGIEFTSSSVQTNGQEIESSRLSPCTSTRKPKRHKTSVWRHQLCSKI
eukprot:Gb_22142 [translate_table: standard]